MNTQLHYEVKQLRKRRDALVHQMQMHLPVCSQNNSVMVDSLKMDSAVRSNVISLPPPVLRQIQSISRLSVGQPLVPPLLRTSSLTSQTNSFDNYNYNNDSSVIISQCNEDIVPSMILRQDTSISSETSVTHVTVCNNSHLHNSSATNSSSCSVSPSLNNTALESVLSTDNSQPYPVTLISSTSTNSTVDKDTPNCVPFMVLSMSADED